MASLRRPARDKTTTSKDKEAHRAKETDKTSVSEPQLDPLRPQRRPRMVALGIALVVISGLGGVALANNLSNSYSVVAVSKDVARGEQITASDLVDVKIPNGSTGLDTIPASQASSLVGQLAASDLHAGTTLSPDSLTDSLGVQDGTSLVGVALTPSQVPGSTLTDGDTVTLVQVAASGSASIEDPKTWTGTVVAVHTSASDSSVRVVDVEISEADAAQVASLAASDQIALILDSQD